MAYTLVQQLRKARAHNKGMKKKLARLLRGLASMLDRKGPEEFSRNEIRAIQAVTGELNNRLKRNERTQKAAELVADETRQKRQE
jgi:hypothetical protein